ncbi:cullin-4-like [Telopea speciosissima]|uniref:cullin-4-like n=1 Tax=Telopea speciosissima TaxID=54955 RepID=UPI001CC55BAA|nr:cullin-4-like [Telopea speciosissima]
MLDTKLASDDIFNEVAAEDEEVGKFEIGWWKALPLATRFLLRKSAFIDVEKKMIYMLESKFGRAFSYTIKGICKDIEYFKHSSQTMEILLRGIEMSVLVLTNSFWPAFRSMDVRLPHKLNVCQDIFNEFYLEKHKRRCLTLIRSLGLCVLKAKFPIGEKELKVPLFQAIVLMFFIDAQKLSFQDIKDSSDIENKELRKTLQSLACEKLCVLRKIPVGRNVRDNDSFVFNKEFSSPHDNIKVNPIQMEYFLKENTNATTQVFGNRIYQVRAAIARIMKKRRKLSLTDLKTELLQQIEELFELELLELDKSDLQILHYLT